MKLKIVLLLLLFSIIAISCKKNENSIPNSQSQTQTDPCVDMGSYNKGVSYGRLQRGGLPDCDTYYYDGAAANKDCWCKGFMEGRK